MLLRRSSLHHLCEMQAHVAARMSLPLSDCLVLIYQTLPLMMRPVLLLCRPQDVHRCTRMHDMSFQHQSHPGFIKYILMSHFLLIQFCLERP